MGNTLLMASNLHASGLYAATTTKAKIINTVLLKVVFTFYALIQLPKCVCERL